MSAQSAKDKDSKNSAPRDNRWIKCISTHGNLRGVGIQATGLVDEIAKRHGLKGSDVRGLGEAIIGALLIGSYCKPGERINLNIQGSGEIKQALVDAHPDGSVRGYVIGQTPFSGMTNDGEELGPWGTGLLSVLRTKGAESDKPYIGTVPLLTGHLAKDLSFYWVQSEQIPSAVGLAVNMEGDRVTTAGGFLVQALPGASLEEVKEIERNINAIQSLAESLSENSDPLHLLSHIFQSTAFMVIEDRPLRFECNCSWERVRRALTLIGAAELQDMLAKDHKATVRCDFCAQEYQVSEDELKKLISGES